MLHFKKPPTTIAEIIPVWIPMALSWLMMGLEFPLITFALSYLADPKIHIAAAGGIALPIAMTIEAPVIALLSASTALCVNKDALHKVFRYTMWIGGSLTALHILISFEPFYGFVSEHLIATPDELYDLTQTALIVLIPWTWSIAIRRFYQGVLIYTGKTRAIGAGTFVRLLAGTLACVACILLEKTFPELINGSMMIGLALSCGVVCEMLYVVYYSRPIAATLPDSHTAETDKLSFNSFMKFYMPLAIGTIIWIMSRPVTAAAVTRMPDAINSLAVWAAAGSPLFIFRSFGVSLCELIIALARYPESRPAIRRFTLWIGFYTTLGFLLFLISPLARLWFEDISGLEPELAKQGVNSLWICFCLPLSAALANYYEGLNIAAGKTKNMTYGVIAMVLSLLIVLGYGVFTQSSSGLTIAMFSFLVGCIAQLTVVAIAAWNLPESK
ncbi:hypothetical protein JNK13_07790 [bacterium]|nr:hypothetical protein [bacterium]